MPPDLDAVRRWAAAHAATVTASGAPITGDQSAAPPRHPVPVVLASITETRTWHTESQACGVSVSAASDGRVLVAVGEVNGAVGIWDSGTGALLHSLIGHTDMVRSVDWGHDRDGRPLLATASRDGTVRIWDPRTGEPVPGSPVSLGEGPPGGADVVSWGYSTDGRTLLAIGGSNGTWIWDPETGEAVHAISDAEGPIFAVSWGTGHHAELLLASAGLDRTVRIYDTGTGQTRHIATGHIGVVCSVAWARRADESMAFATVGFDMSPGGAETSMRLWREGRDGEFSAEIVDLAQGQLCIVSWVHLPDGRTLLVGNSVQSLFVLDGSTLELLHTQPVDFSGRGVHNLGWAVSPDGTLMLGSTSAPDRVHVWTVTLDPPIPVPASGSPSAGRRPAAATHPTPRPARAVLSSITETRTWRTESHACGASTCTAPDGRVLLAVGEEDGSVRLWDPETGEMLRSLTGHTKEVYAVDCGHDSDGRPLLATGSDDGTVRVWDPQTGELVHGSPSFGGHNDIAVVSWGYSADGKALLAIGADDGAWIWDAETGTMVHAITDVERISTVSWGSSHDTELLLAAAGTGPTVRIHDVGTGQTLHVLTGHEKVRTVAWATRTRESLMFTTTEWRHSARTAGTELTLWRERRDGEFAAETVDLAQGPLRTVRWIPLPDGRTLLAGSSESSLFVLDGSTLELLHTQPVDFSGRGLHNLGWTVAPDGNLMLCGTSNPDHVHVWTIALDPPIQVPVPGQRDQALVRAGQRGTLLIPPEDVTPRFQAEPNMATTHSLRCTVRTDGQVIAATWHMDGRLRVWAVSAGTLLHTITLAPDGDRRLAWGHMPDGRLLLATASRAGPDIQIWDSSTWQLMAIRVHQSEDQGGVDGLAWVHDQDGRPLLASGGEFDGTVCIQDPESGVTVRSFTGHGSFSHAIAEGRLADGRRCLVTCDSAGPARLSDLDTGEFLFEFSGSVASQVWAAAWGRGPDGRPVLAVGGRDGIAIRDPETGEVLRTVTGHAGEVHSLCWPDQPGWPPVLISSSFVSSGGGGTVQIWDPGTGEELARLPCVGSTLYNIGVAPAPDGDLLLLTTAHATADDPAPLRVWRIATRPAAAAGADSGPRGALGTHQAAWLTERLLCLGDGGLWPPLGLLADLVTLTGPAAAVQPQALCDPRLAALTGEPGLDRLRDLAAGPPAWGPEARVTLAALLASTLGIPEQYTPPAGAGTLSLRDALAGTLSAPTAASTARPWRVPAADVRKAAAAITGQSLTLLRILGPDACAADPLLPLRLAHHVPQLPVLSQRELQLLTGTPGRRPANGRAAAAGTLVYSPGTAGLTRSGPPTRLLPTELALPRDLLAVRLAGDQLLYRQHRAPVPPAPEPVTIILDTTPPTFGPAGQALRLAVHLITLTLRDHDRYPSLITLTSPGTVTDLRTPADLVHVWATATLQDPLPALAIARATAAATGQPALFCTHHHTARDSYLPGPATRLLTTHQPPEQPPRPPASRWHAHLPPSPAQDQLTAAITQLLTPHTSDRA
jgi:WD40 repeat protein